MVPTQKTPTESTQGNVIMTTRSRGWRRSLGLASRVIESSVGSRPRLVRADGNAKTTQEQQGMLRQLRSSMWTCLRDSRMGTCRSSKSELSVLLYMTGNDVLYSYWYAHCLLE
jgi:hypothetical protein